MTAAGPPMACFELGSSVVIASVGQTSPQRMQEGSHQPRRMSRIGVKRPSIPVFPKSVRITPVGQEAEHAPQVMQRARNDSSSIAPGGRIGVVRASVHAATGGPQDRREGRRSCHGQEEAPPADIEGGHRCWWGRSGEPVVQALFRAGSETVEAHVALAHPVLFQGFVGALTGEDAQGAAGTGAGIVTADAEGRQTGEDPHQGAQRADRPAEQTGDHGRQKQDRRQQPKTHPTSRRQPAVPQRADAGGKGTVEQWNGIEPTNVVGAQGGPDQEDR